MFASLNAATVAAGGLIAASALAGGAAAQAPSPPFMSYAAKFVCGVQAKDVDVVRGVYATTINVHNPQATIPVNYFKKAVIALPESSQTHGQISNFVAEMLGPDQALGVDCNDIRSLFPSIVLPPEIDGFVVIEVPSQAATNFFPLLDVVGKYTVRHEDTKGADPTISDANGLNVVPVTAKKITK